MGHGEYIYTHPPVRFLVTSHIKGVFYKRGVISYRMGVLVTSHIKEVFYIDSYRRWFLITFYIEEMLGICFIRWAGFGLVSKEGGGFDLVSGFEK